MTEKYRSRMYPVFAIFISLFIMIFGFLRAKHISCTYFLSTVYLLFLTMGFYKSCLKFLPPFIIIAAIFSGITYIINCNVLSTLAMTNRLFAIFISIIPGTGIRPVDLTRNLNQLKIPRAFTLGMLISLNFVPLLKKEVKYIREAMKTRGAGNIINFKVFYRAFLIPLIMRVVNISDTLSLSVETRGFSIDDNNVSVYRPVKPLFKDFAVIFLVVILACLSMVIK